MQKNKSLMGQLISIFVKRKPIFDKGRYLKLWSGINNKKEE